MLGQTCGESSDPDACVACLTAAVRDDLKADLCDDCAATKSPWECNECLTSAIDDDVSYWSGVFSSRGTVPRQFLLLARRLG